ncbi:4Fe-4S ferredoxin iron-sulfur binding domain-containing protein [Candidatus Omnitrophus magneticus]|uniref:4Fe-4S ferredoxin iron-sulfur binding domain-containing protein n=1 Tax=Candidatus Omnitrophus magneticus TaxID=1609969 RepID=A0A0F0CK86_9BACT|nr:4Fe-4S ferredoxin iron-sulfur binding domain-containing protein [Candidatus Omnitrophus magneticus]
MLTSTTFVGIVLALIFHQRIWCLMCPIGTMSSWLGKNKYPLKIDSKLCVDCKICGKVCPIEIEPYKFKNSPKKTVQDADCLKCASCVNICPKKALKF